MGLRLGEEMRAIAGGHRVLRAARLAVLLAIGTRSASADVVLQGMPDYKWWSGCLPTSAGMIFGYWNDPVLYPFFDGDATVWSGASYSSNPADGRPGGTAAMVGSWDHVREGELAGYNTNIGEGKWTPDNRDANCIADFMGTDRGATTASGARYGIEAFALWDNPATPDFNEHVHVSTSIYWTFDTSTDPWDVFMAEINAGRPSIVLLRAGTTGHAVAAYGYSSTGYMAVRDTWNDGVSNAPSGSYIDGNGVEWWPWNPTWTSYVEGADYSLADIWESGDITYGAVNWTVDSVITFYADPAPEPGTMALVLLGVGGLTAWRRRRAAGGE